MPSTPPEDSHPSGDRPRVVIVGAGFGGLAAAKALEKAPVAVTLIDRQNHHLFQPLLYQVSTGELAGSEVGEPVRRIFRRSRNVRVYQDEVTAIDTGQRCVRTAHRTYPYDYLILATGSVYNYFGNPEWSDRSLSLKTMYGALELRERIFTVLERAERSSDTEERDRLLTFAIIGGGPTGVELAGSLADLLCGPMVREFSNFDCSKARVILFQSGGRLLRGFSERLQIYAHQALEKKGVEVRLNHRAEQIEREAVTAGGSRYDAATIIWAAGVKPRPAAKWIDAPTDGKGRIEVQPDLSVPGHANIFAIGDIARVEDPDGRPLTALAAVAKQEGRHAARAIRAAAAGGPKPPVFRYRDYGMLATVGHYAAVADLKRLSLTGLPGWLVWNGAHIWFLLGMRNRFFVALRWALTLTARNYTSRVIVSQTRAEREEKREVVD